MTGALRIRLAPRVLACVVMGGAVALLGGVVAPGLIDSGSVFGDDPRRAARALELLRGLTLAGTLASLLSALGLHALTVDAQRERPVLPRLVGGATPTAVGAIRALSCGIALWFVLWEDLASIASLPPALSLDMGVMALLCALPGFNALLQSHSGLLALEWLTAALLLAAALGFRTRLTLPLAAVAYLVFAGMLRMYTHFFHTGLLPLYLLAVLSLTPCGDGFSLDRWLRVRRGLPVPDAWTATLRYGWARYAVWGTIGITYFAAGVAKLRNGGWGWWDAVNMRTKIVQESLQQTRFFDFQPGLVLKDAPDFVFALLGLGTIVLEIGMICVLLSPLARRVIPLLIVGMHFGILVSQKILFIDSVLIQLVFYDNSRWVRPAERPERAAEAKPPAFVAAGSARLPATVVVLLATYFAVVIGKVEIYPLTSWQMYSRRTRAPEVTYYRAHVVSEAGKRRPIRLDHFVGVLFDARYVDVLRIPFGPRPLEPVAELFESFAAQGAGALAGERVAAYEIEQRVWNYETDAANPEHGRVANLRRFEVDDIRPEGGLGRTHD